VLVGKEDPEGEGRIDEQDKGKAMAGKSTLNRLEAHACRADGGRASIQEDRDEAGGDRSVAGGCVSGILH